MRKIHILIAEDVDFMRRILALHLSQHAQFEIVGEATNGREAVEMTAKLHPDVVLMDLDMPVLNGILAMERILGADPTIRVILLTGHDNLVSLGRLGGAAAALRKNSMQTELVEAILNVCKDRPGLHGGGATLHKRQGALEKLAARAGLTEREKTVVEKMVYTALSVAEIAVVLTEEWGTPVSVSAVKSTQVRAMMKLRVEPRTRMALSHLVQETEDEVE